MRQRHAAQEHRLTRQHVFPLRLSRNTDRGRFFRQTAIPLSSYPFAVLRGSKGSEAATRYLAFLSSAQARPPSKPEGFMILRAQPE